jgi:5-methyltetrahydropteroyltriglutamate--homocysteine methyltransferase
MSQILTANIGSTPRIGEEKDQQRHRRASHHVARKEISAHAFSDVQQSVTQDAVHEQIALGLDEITNGLVTWNDAISPFCEHLGGVECRGVARYFEHNFYYRVPVIVGKPQIKNSTLADDYAYAQSISIKPVRAILTGPHTRK